eukprot:305963_1
MQFLEEFRELASKGQYELALQSFKEFSEEIGEMEKDKKTSMIEGYSWKQIKNELQKEEHLVKEILNELRFFANAKTFGPQSIDHGEANDLFKPNYHKRSIQQRYESQFANKKHNKSDRVRHNHKKRGMASRNRSSNEANDNSKRNKDRKERHHTNRKRERPNHKQPRDDDGDDNTDRKYKAPAGIDYYLVDMIEESVIQRKIGVTWK